MKCPHFSAASPTSTELSNPTLLLFVASRPRILVYLTKHVNTVFYVRSFLYGNLEEDKAIIEFLFSI